MVGYGWPAAFTAGIAALAFFGAIAWYVGWVLLYMEDYVPWWATVLAIFTPIIVAFCTCAYFLGFPVI